MKISIVGGGIMGLASAWALARDGHSVAVLEQGTLPNPLGSSVEEHRLIRHRYGAEGGYTRMIGPAYAAWDQLWADLGATHYAPTGTLVLDRGDPWTADTAETLAAEGIPFKRVGPRGVIETYPMLAADHVRGGLVLDSGGSLFARRIVAHLARYLDGRGVDIGSEILVRRVDPERGRLWIADDIHGDQPVDAHLLIVAAGPPAARLLLALHPSVSRSGYVLVCVCLSPALAAGRMARPL